MEAARETSSFDLPNFTMSDEEQARDGGYKPKQPEESDPRDGGYKSRELRSSTPPQPISTWCVAMSDIAWSILAYLFLLQNNGDM